MEVLRCIPLHTIKERLKSSPLNPFLITPLQCIIKRRVLSSITAVISNRII
jgi:radical SAM superfamily enzyme